MGLTDTGWLKAAKTTSLRRRIHCDVICHTTARRRSWQLSPDSDIGPSDPTLPGHSWGQYLVGTIPRSIRICVANLVMIGPAVWPPILDRQTHTHTHTHTQNLYYIDIDIQAVYIFSTSTLQCINYTKGEGHTAQHNKVWSPKNIHIKTNKVNMAQESNQTDQTEADEGRWRSRKW